VPTVRDPRLVDTEVAAFYVGRTAFVIYRWAREGRLTRHGGQGKGQARWDLWELTDLMTMRPLEGAPPKKPSKFQDRA